LDPIFDFSQIIFFFQFFFTTKTSGLVSKHTCKRTMLGQLSFHSNLNERAFSKLKSEFPEKEKEKEEIKIKSDLGETFRPNRETSPRPTQPLNRNGTLQWPSPSLTCGPHLPVVFNLQPFLSPATVSSNPHSPFNSFTPHSNRRIPAAISSP
jgi:hypothetical protein